MSLSLQPWMPAIVSPKICSDNKNGDDALIVNFSVPHGIYKSDHPELQPTSPSPPLPKIHLPHHPRDPLQNPVKHGLSSQTRKPINACRSTLTIAKSIKSPVIFPTSGRSSMKSGSKTIKSDTESPFRPPIVATILFSTGIENPSSPAAVPDFTKRTPRPII
ncbi:hypothetical protein ACLOJK_030567 [Asimina triloba]